MRLYLVRHGDAASAPNDSLRPLSASGAAEIDRMAQSLAGTGVIDVAEIRHSTKLRAQQTAERLARGLALGVPLREVGFLSPMADVALAAREVAAATENMMFVGHMPHVAKLASMLICGDPYQGAFAFDTGTILCLRRHPAATGDANEPAPAWFIEWMFSPQLIET